MKRLGDYIRPVDVRNRDLKVTRLVGLTIDKAFIPSVANTIGTDLSNYKVISENQFACSLMQVSRDGKMPIAMFKGEPCIMSPAYPMFEVSKKNELLPEYLMMWFSRSEFDREASFYAVGGVRGSLEWNDFCDMQIPVPAIEKQREIVAEYNTLATRIETNKKLIATLEQTAQTLYRHTFVDNIDPNNLPEGWRMGTIGDLCEISSSKRIFENEYCDEGIPFYRGKEITQKKNGEPISDLIYISNERYQELVQKYGKPEEGDILLTAVGTLGNSYMVQQEEFYFKDGNLVWLNNFIEDGVNFYLYAFMQTSVFEDKIVEISIGSTQKAITISSLSKLAMLIPAVDALKTFAKDYQDVYNHITLKIEENLKLQQMQTLLLSKMGNYNE
jgi:type I restriction enzyme S subunit